MVSSPQHLANMGSAAATDEKPLKTGLLDSRFDYEDITPTIGREYHDVDIVKDLMQGPDADELLRDLGITSETAPPPPSLLRR